MGRRDLRIAPCSVFLTLTVFILLVLASVSAVSKSVDSISFLKADFPTGTINFGAFAYTGSGQHVGYDFPAGVVPNMSPFTGDYFHVLTGFMILHPIAAGFTGVAVIFGILELAFMNWAAAGVLVYISSLASSFIFLAFCFDLGLWIHVRNEIRRQGIHAELGNAVWMTLSASIIIMGAYLLGSCAMGEIMVIKDEDRNQKDLKMKVRPTRNYSCSI